MDGDGGHDWHAITATILDELIVEHLENIPELEPYFQSGTLGNELIVSEILTNHGVGCDEAFTLTPIGRFIPFYDVVAEKMIKHACDRYGMSYRGNFTCWINYDEDALVAELRKSVLEYMELGDNDEDETEEEFACRVDCQVQNELDAYYDTPYGFVQQEV